MQFSYATANLNDAPFIESLLLAGARKNHFNPDLIDKRDFLRKDVQSMISKKQLLDSPLYAETTIYKAGAQRAGFSIMSGITDFPNCIEIYALSVQRPFRGTGLGSSILDEILYQWLPRCDVYARCSAASEQLFQMLLRRQFEFRFTMPNGMRVLHCQQLPHRSRA